MTLSVCLSLWHDRPMADAAAQRMMRDQQLAKELGKMMAQISALPENARKVRIDIRCRDCGKEWRAVRYVRDEALPYAIREQLANARIHIDLSGHSDVPVEIGPEL